MVRGGMWVLVAALAPAGARQPCDCDSFSDALRWAVGDFPVLEGAVRVPSAAALPSQLVLVKIPETGSDVSFES